MRIEELHIDGFGRFSGLSLRQMSSGLSIVLGDNEAGKSTLLAFLRSVLFGLPSRKQKEFYPALNGGRKGGRVVLLDRRSERIIVERCEGKGTGPLTITFPDGRTGGEEAFRPLIGSATAELYENVFAFSLSELQEFGSLNTGKVRDAIYSAGVGVGRRTLTEVSRDLVNRSGELFAPGGSKPQMNKLLTQIEQLQGQIKEHRLDQERYEQSRSELDICNAAVEKVKAELSTARQRADRVRILQQAWDDWIALGSDRRQLQDIPVIDAFPPGGISRMESLILELRTFRDQLSEVSSEREQTASKLDAIRFDDAVFRSTEEIRRLERGRELFESSLRQQPEQRTECELAERKLAQLLTELGDAWSETRLAAFSLPQSSREELDATCRRVQSASEAVRLHLTQLDIAQQDQTEAEEAVKSALAQIQQLPELQSEKFVSEARKVVSGRGSFESLRLDLSGVQKQLELGLGGLQDSLMQIGPDWTEERLRNFDTSLAVQDQIAGHRTQLSDLRAGHLQATGRVEDAARNHADADAEFNRAAESLVAFAVPAESDEAVLLERRRAIRSLRALSSEVSHLQEKQADITERIVDVNAQLDRHGQVGLSGDPELIPAWAVPLLVAVGLVGLLGLGLGREDWVTGGIVLALTVGLAGLVIFVARAAKERGKLDREQRSRDCAELEIRRGTLQQSESDLCGRLEKVNGQFTELATSADLATQFDVRDLNAAEADVEAAVELLQRRRPVEQKHSDAQASLAKCNQTLIEARRRKDELAVQLKDAVERWSGWLIATGLPESLTPESAANVLAKLDAAREQLKSIDRDRGRVTQILAAMRDYEDKVRAITVHWLLESEAGDDVLRVVDDLAVSLGQYDRDAQTQGDLHRQLKDGEERVANLKRRVDATSKSHRESLNAEQRVTEEWNSLLLHIGLETTLTAENARQALQAIERARDQLTVVTDRRAHVESLLQSIGSYRREVLATAAAAGLTTSSADDASHTVSELLVLLEHEDEARRTAVGLVEKVEVADNRLVQLQRKIDGRQCAIDELFAEAESVDEKSFRLKAEHFEQRRETQHRIKQCETRLCQLVGSGEALRALQNELQISSPEALSREKHELDEQIQNCEQNHTDAADERGRLKEQLEQLEKTDELSQLRIEEQSARTELETGAVDWSVQKLAAYLIDRAREKYERERRPAVLSEAESFFSRFTGGRYSEIRPSDDGSCVVVRTPDGQTKETDQLSRGTAEQLYLSLRFGFVSEFVRHFEPLPLVFDDILVNFDPVRARAAAEAILELASSQQILFFTCQPATAKLFQELQPDVSTFELKNGNFT